ncbi:MAG: cation transporter, partial [Alphaproteobacteria bacterium]|nr:cation transporter [Alphaproteobacteria bacterium]
IDINKLQGTLAAVENVKNVHDLHVWTITSGINALSVHLQVSESEKCASVLNSARQTLRTEFGIEHVTIQTETDDLCSEQVKLPF